VPNNNCSEIRSEIPAKGFTPPGATVIKYDFLIGFQLTVPCALVVESISTGNFDLGP
jgi:hypothetical protein